jgi:hypothetical protein
MTKAVQISSTGGPEVKSMVGKGIDHEKPQAEAF